ncbi:MAG TPA: ABC transporter permease subunit, partial [Rhodospirillales bacterium]|nr:ABC transporter permease subunit [Rhodospirillales bacterium]
MTATLAASAPRRVNPWLIGWVVALGFVALLQAYGRDDLAWAFKFPRDWVIPLRFWLSDLMKWLLNEFDLGLFTFRQFTRSIAWVIEQPYWLVKSLLSTGFLQGQGSGAVVLFPRISWVAIIGIVMLMGVYAKDRKLALLVGGCFFYLVLFGQWDSAMVTLSSIIIAVPFGVAGGLSLGILAYRSPGFERLIRPLLDLMQTVPVFAYLVPILILFGFGPVSAMIATIIYALPPMARVTILALRQVPAELTEFGAMAGCSRSQILWKIQIPAAKATL